MKKSHSTRKECFLLQIDWGVSMSEINDFLMLIASMSLIFLIIIMIGEWRVGKEAKWNFQIAKRIKKECHSAKILTDVELHDKKKMWGGRSKVNIDLVVIIGISVYVIHFVDVKGYVYGHEVTKVWWSIYKSKKKFLNPMEICYMESEIVKKIVPKATNIIPMVVFPDETNLNYIDVSSDDIKIIYASQLTEFICMKRSNVEGKYTKEIYELLQNAN